MEKIVTKKDAGPIFIIDTQKDFIPCDDFELLCDKVQKINAFAGTNLSGMINNDEDWDWPPVFRTHCIVEK